MYIPLGIKTDYSLLKSLIKISDLISFGVENKLPALGILDDNLFGSIEFYDNLIKNNIKPIIGLDICLNDKHLYLYAQDYEGYKSLLKLNTITQERNITVSDLKEHFFHVILVIPFNNKDVYNDLNKIFEKTYISYQNDYEKKNALIITNNIVFINIIDSYKATDAKYLNILDSIRDDNTTIVHEYDYFLECSASDIKTTYEFIANIDVKIDKSKRYIPHYSNDINDSFNYLINLCNKGLNKRLNGQVPDIYNKRLNYELKVINDMGYVDYFLIVYDYVKYAKTHDIMVGPGRGSAAGSLVSYAIGITNIDPLKYNLLFERFLNPERVTMPDIDVDFEDVKRDEMVSYVKDRYGITKVAPIMTYGTLASRQVLKDVSKALNKQDHIEELCHLIDQKKSLKDNLEGTNVKRLLTIYPELKEIYQVGIKLEGIKRHISTHAAGVVICSIPLDDIIPICNNDSNILTGITMNYLEELGLLKMDFLALSNLTIIHNVLDLIKEPIDLNKIALDDPKIYNMFDQVETTGIFQFDSMGMKNFIRKLQPKNFSDLYAALALFRPGPMGNIDSFIARKNGHEKIDYLDESLEPILHETYGIIVYQEQIMQILAKMANYTFAEADNIRRAMSKKKEKIIIESRQHFILSSINNGYSKEIATKVYEQILKFANYGFNKAHSVSYAFIGYQMAYLKVYYPVYFIANLLNMSIGSDEKTKEYLNLAKQKNIYILKPSINLSIKEYKIGSDKLRLPLSVIKQVGNIAATDILNIRENGEYKDFFDFVARTYGKSVTRKTLEYLIYAGALDEFKVNHHTLINNIDNALRYAELRSNLDESLIEKPVLEIVDEYNSSELMEQEYNSYGFYISNHPASKYNTKDIVKLSQISKYFNQFIKCVVIINNVREIKTKKGTNMCFITASDETNMMEFVLFPKNMVMLNDIKKNDLVEINGLVARRFDKYQININKISKIEGGTK
jgi:DNA polymerase-3 subunit alpha